MVQYISFRYLNDPEWAIEMRGFPKSWCYPNSWIKFISWKISKQLMITGGTPISGNLQIGSEETTSGNVPTNVKISSTSQTLANHWFQILC